MRLNYKKIGDYIRLVDERNKDLQVSNLLGLTISKAFIPSVANTVGTNMKSYKIIKKNQFACSLMQVRRDKKIPIAIYKGEENAIISQAYPMFEVKDEEELLPDYLMMWFSRKEFDRESCFYAVGGVRGSVEWEDFCDMEFPLLPIEKQREIVKEYNVVKDRIELNNKLIQKLEETAQAIYKQWFVEFEFPNENGKPYKSSGGEMVWCEELEKDVPRGWKCGEFSEIMQITSGKTPFDKNDIKTSKYNYPIYGAGGIMGYSSKSLFDEKILSMGRVGTHGVIKRINFSCWASDNTLIIKSLYYEYAYQILLNVNYVEINRGGVQGLITQTDIKNLNIIIPNSEILDKFEKKIGEVLFYLDSKLFELEKIEILQNLLLSKLATVNN